MKYFRERQRITKPQTVPAAPPPLPAPPPLSAPPPLLAPEQGPPEAGLPDGPPAKMAATANARKKEPAITTDVQVQNTPETHIEPRAGKSRERCRERLLRARRRKDIRLSRKEVSCLQLLVQNVLNEHLALSRELQAAYERLGLPVDVGDNAYPREITPLARNVGRLQSVLERDAARLNAALQEREERLERVMAEADALRSELQTWRRVSAEEAEKRKADLDAALAERDVALDNTATKDQIISNLRSELAILEAKRSTEALSMSRALTEKEVYITILETQARENQAQIEALKQLQEELSDELNSERVKRISSAEKMDDFEIQLKKMTEEYQCTAIMLSQVISDKEAEINDLVKQMDEVKSKCDHDITTSKRENDARIAEIKHNGERAVAQKILEMHKVECALEESKEQIRRLKQDLESKRSQISVLHGELATTRTEIATTTESAASATRRVTELDAELAQERQRHEHDTQTLTSAHEAELNRVRMEATSMQEELQKKLKDQRDEAAAANNKIKSQLTKTQKKLRQVEEVAARTPALESDLKKLTADLAFMQEKSVEQNTKLTTIKREKSQLSGEIEKLKNELSKLKAKSEAQLEEMRKKTEKEASDFRKALHEKDVEIREHQDRLKLLQEEEKKTEQKHRSVLQSERTSHRESERKLQKDLSKQSERIKRQEEQIKTLQTKIEEQNSQHTQETEKLNSRIKTLESSRAVLEKKLRENEALLKENETAREKVEQELSSAVANNYTLSKNLDDIRVELKNVLSDLDNERGLFFSTKAELDEAKAEAIFALDTIGKMDLYMCSIFAKATEDRFNLKRSELKIAQMVEEFEKSSAEAKEQIKKQKTDYTRLKVRFIKYIKLREDELKAAGDSAEHNGCEARRYLHELQKSNSELATASARCKSIQQELEFALQKIEDLSENKIAAQRSRELLAVAENELRSLRSTLEMAENELKSLRSNLENETNEVVELRMALSEKEIQIQRLNAELDAERSNVALITQRATESQQLIEHTEKLLSQAEEDKRDLRYNFELQKSELDELKIILASKESQVESLVADLSKERDNSQSLMEKQAQLLFWAEENKRKISLQEAEISYLKEVLERKGKDLMEVETALSCRNSELQTLNSDFSQQQSDLASSIQRESELKLQVKENKRLLFLARAEVEALRSDLEQQNSNIIELRNTISEKESELEVVFSNSNKEEASLSKQLSEYEAAFSLIENSSKQGVSRHLIFDPTLGLTDKINLLLKTICNLEKDLSDAILNANCINERNASLENKLASTLAELNGLTSVRDRLETCISEKEKELVDLQGELQGLRAQFSEQQSHITHLEISLAESYETTSVALKSKESVIQKEEEVKMMLKNANLEIDLLKTQLNGEKQREFSENSTQSEDESCKQERSDITKRADQSPQNQSQSQKEGATGAENSQVCEDGGTAKVRNTLDERDQEEHHLRNLLELAHQECERKMHDSADGDGNKDTHAEGLEFLRAALAERDADVAKLQLAVVDLQDQLSSSKTSSFNEIARYRVRVDELNKQIAQLTDKLEDQKSSADTDSDNKFVDFGLHSTEEQTTLVSENDVSVNSSVPRSSLRRTTSEIS